MNVTKDNIWNFAQNKPTQVVQDICERYPEVDPDFVYKILLKRGVFKWLAVRRDLIKLKHVWKKEINELHTILTEAGLNKEKYKFRRETGAIKALNRCRQAVRKLCHSERWQAPDFDRKANEYLNSL